jgi:4-hydroxy-tetrahydrodipicolinate synthase
VLKEGPAIIYNVPSRTGQDIPDDLVHHMAAHPNFLGMKECTGNERIGNYTKQVRGAWCVLVAVCGGGASSRCST